MGRRGSGVEKRETSIRIAFTIDGVEQRETLRINGEVMKPTPANLKYAHRLAAEIRDRIKHGTFSMAEYFPAAGGAPAQLTVGKQLRTWLAAQRVEASTSAGYESAVKFWEGVRCNDAGGALGVQPLRSLKLSQVLTGLASRPELSGKTVNNYVSVLRQAVELAVADRLLPSNPVDAVQRAKWQREPPDPFSLEEAEAIVADLHQKAPAAVANMVEWWFFAGPRPSEVVALRWGNVDFASDYVLISEATVRGIEKDRTKTQVARTVMLNVRSRAALERQKAHTFLAGDHVWLDPRYGTPWTDERAFRRSYWAPCLKRLGIRYRSQRHMRHTYATMLLMAGRTPAWCAKQMGHSIEVFLNTYSRWIPGAQDHREVDALDAWIQGGTPAEPGRNSAVPGGNPGRNPGRHGGS